MKTTQLSDTRNFIRFFSLFLLPWTGFLTSEIFGVEEFEFEFEIIVTAMFFVFGSFWCGWFCPFGNASYFISKIGKSLFPSLQRNIIPAIDKPLRYVKYLVLLLFIYALWISGVNYFTDDHMDMYFSTEFTSFFIGAKKYFVLVVPLLIPRFFCKYLCFQKAGYNIINRLFPVVKISRDHDACINCKKCDTTCPSQLPISTVSVVTTEDCLGCYKCLDENICPKKVEALSLSYFGKKVKPISFALVAITVYITATAIVYYLV